MQRSSWSLSARLRKAAISFGIAMGIVAGGIEQAALADDSGAVMLVPSIHTITTRGEAQVNVVPDKFTITVGIQTFDKVLANAYAISDKSNHSSVGAGSQI